LFTFINNESHKKEYENTHQDIVISYKIKNLLNQGLFQQQN
jgi:hypothetical protein